MGQLPRQEGDTIEFDKVLLVVNGDEAILGRPIIEGAKVIATIVGQGKGQKIIVLKYKPKVRYRKKIGHRQPYTKLVIKEIVTS